MNKMSKYEIEKKIRVGDNYAIYSAKRISDGKRVVVKTPLNGYENRRSVAQLANEFEIAGKIDHENIVRCVDLVKMDNRPLLIREYFEASPLDEIIPGDGFDMETFLEIAVRILDGLSEIHENNIIHQLITPENILVNPPGRDVKITNFGRSAYNTSQVIDAIENFKNSAAYISPEQTGRMNRAIDYRTDFYTLGVTFYKMLTGRLPFYAGDILEMAHAHLAKKAVAPHRINRAVHPVASKIILKLLSKNADERYQSAEGLIYDLDHCRKCLARQKGRAKNLEAFAIARRDFSGKFRMPQALYGREKVMARLHRQLAGVCEGGTAILLVTGCSGVGKSAVVNELRRKITIKNAWFAAGKYEHLKRNIAYSAITRVFEELIKQILCERDERIEIWREKLLGALGANGRIIIDIVPELELIIGKQPPVQELGSGETRNRLNMVFQNFVAVFDRMAHPLIIFLDDLQWIDHASLNLIKLITAGRLTRSFFFIGAYRSNEVDASHPVTAVMEEIRKTGVDMQTIDLHPLDPDSVNRWTADALNRPPDETRALSDLISQKTGGNPFFIKSFLWRLHEEQLIRYTGRGRWRWSLKEIIQTRPADNVAELMIANMRKLPADVREILMLGACFGIEFKTRDLSVIAARSKNHVHQM
ncbi:MAG: AAA family ATPase, partial [Desulfobacterales bacterium]|nr:AAA family ATPase [Desulfobacterales bacterium]